MNTNNFINDIFMLFLSVSIILFTVILLGWLVYNRLFLRGLSLKDVLFKKNSLTIWLEFIGGFLIPALFLVSMLMVPSGKFIYQGKFVDLLAIISYIIIYILILSLFRYLASKAIKLIGKWTLKYEIDLEDEIFKQENIAASLFSISISTLVIGMLLQENFFAENLFTNLIRIGLVFIMTLGLLSVHKTLFYPKHSSLFKELFIDDNVCAGILLLGHTIAVNLIIFSSIEWFRIPASGWYNIFNIIDVTIFICVIYLIMIVFVSGSKLVMNAILAIDIDHQLFEENNVGYSILESSFYIMLSIIIINGLFIK